VRRSGASGRSGCGGVDARNGNDGRNGKHGPGDTGVVVNYLNRREQTDAERVAEMCRDAAAQIYATREQPSLAYQQRVARLLFMTIAHESGAFRWRRQLGFRADSDRGAFGLGQCERGSIMDSTKFCDARPAVESRVRSFLFDWPGWSSWPLMRSHLQTLEGDRLSVALCRLHYLRVPTLVPGGLEDQARYAKQWYNTALGKATWQQYRDAFLRLWPEAV